MNVAVGDISSAACNTAATTQNCFGVISLNDEQIMLKTISDVHQRCFDDVFLKECRDKCDVANSGFAVRNGVVCKLKGDYHAPVIPSNAEDLKNLILVEIHASGLGGHLSVAKM